jgi:hypothetical protein
MNAMKSTKVGSHNNKFNRGSTFKQNRRKVLATRRNK